MHRYSSCCFYSVDSGQSFRLGQGQDFTPEHENFSNHRNYSLLNNGSIMEPAGFRKSLNCLVPFGTYSLSQGTFSLVTMPEEGDEAEAGSQKREQDEQAPMW